MKKIKDMDYPVYIGDYTSIIGELHKMNRLWWDVTPLGKVHTKSFSGYNMDLERYKHLILRYFPNAKHDGWVGQNQYRYLFDVSDMSLFELVGRLSCLVTQMKLMDT